MVRILALSLPRAWVQSLIRELRSHRLQGGAKKLIKKCLKDHVLPLLNISQCLPMS